MSLDFQCAAPDQVATVMPTPVTVAALYVETGGGCSDNDVAGLAALFWGVHFDGGRESLEDALAVVESFGSGIQGLNDTFARQIILAAEVRRLQAKSAVEPGAQAGREAVTLQERIAELVAEHGSLRAVGRALCVDVSYLSRLQAGSKTAPSKKLASQMGLRSIVTYERLNKERKP